MCCGFISKHPNSFIIKKETLNCLFNIIVQMPTLAAYFKKNLCVDF